MGQPSKKTWPWIVGPAAVMTGLIGCGNPNPPPLLAPAPTSATTTSMTSSAARAAMDLVVPESAGKNGRIAMDELRKLGLTNVILVSQDRHDTPIASPENWIVLSIEPHPGTPLSPESLVILTMIKRGTVVPVPAPEPPLYTPVPDNVYYPHCAAARAAGAAPLYAGEPGYSSKLDRDGDGVACES